MNSYFSSICTAVLLPISFISLMGNNNPSSAVSSQPERANIQASSQLISDNRSVEPAEKVQFYCGKSYHGRLDKKVPTTIAQKGSEKHVLIQWVKPIGKYWTPEKRCQEASHRMQVANATGKIEYIINGKMNGQNVICSAISVGGGCNKLLITLHPGDKPLNFLIEFKDVLHGRPEPTEQ
jgi:Circadian oscillating protein COP23